MRRLSQNLNLLWIAVLVVFTATSFGRFPFGEQAVSAQEPSAPQANTQGGSEELQAAQREYDQAVAELKRLTKQAFLARLSYEAGSRDESEAHQKSWDQALADGERQRIVLEAAALRLAGLSDKLSPELLNLLIQIHKTYIRLGYWHRAEVVAKILRGPLAKDEAFLCRDAIATISKNDFEAAAKFRENYGHLVPNLPIEQRELYFALPELIQKYDREKKFLEQDASGEPLPRVVLKTTKGKIEVELFEDQAPDTVANFIYLVEQGFYSEINFHRVIHGFMAQAGGYDTSKMPRDPGYAIYDEYGLNDSREHFQGYLSMANASVPRSASSQFFINFVPTPHLDGKHAVFGRVIDGFEAMEAITRTDYKDEEGQQKEIPDVKPDYIISAEVIRKRNHEYAPRKVQ
ncbi:MAG: peptidylprolyl isomerase [Planctomycetota bacterium]